VRHHLYAPTIQRFFDPCADIVSQYSVHWKHIGSSRRKLATNVALARVYLSVAARTGPAGALIYFAGHLARFSST
jgi:hypothetical protein